MAATRQLTTLGPHEPPAAARERESARLDQVGVAVIAATVGTLEHLAHDAISVGGEAAATCCSSEP